MRDRLEDSSNDALRVELAGQLEWLERRRDTVREKLEALESEPDGTWENLKAELEDEWDTLVQDFEERVASLV